MEISMAITGNMLIGRADVRGTDAELHALDPAANRLIEPPFGGGGAAEVERACQLAAEAFDEYSHTGPEERACFIEGIAGNLETQAGAIVARCMLETGLAHERLAAELSWTVGQLRMFAAVVRRGFWRDATIDPADPDRQPTPRPDLRMQKVALGPVAVFGASNFPLLYSVAGGDTASALAAGCPVIVKAHGAHLGTSELVGRAIRKAVADAGFPEGVFSLVIGAGNEVGEALVDHKAIKAVAFTGSETGGMALVRRGQRRPEPIPVFAEMTSVNPHFLLPHAQVTRAAAFAKRFVEQMTAGAGQMCLKPGMILAIDGEGFDVLRDSLRTALSAVAAQTMLTPNIHHAYERGVEDQRSLPGVSELAHGAGAQKTFEGQAHIFEIDAAAVIDHMALTEEVFGPAAILIRCASVAQMQTIALNLGGQLSIVLHADANDVDVARMLLPAFERKTGRIVANGFSNIVEISDAQIHGGPFPATSDPRFTSVGSTAINRFLRPVSYQNFPAELLPPALRDDNPLNLWRLRDKLPGRV
jgi:alpha-ketoglutaric semialdehyde dehydrogenase